VHIVSVVGARPQFVKLAPIAAELARHPDVRHTIVHTGQHYDANMSDVFFDELDIPEPDVNLEIGSGPHGQQTGRMLEAIERVLNELRPDWTLVYGDTNSTIAGALAAVKLDLPVAHLEAGLRSFNRAMPEEHNRVLTDHASDLLLAPTALAMRNLEDEGLASRARLVGDVMTDVCLLTAGRMSDATLSLPPGVLQNKPFLIATIHRAENTDKPDRLSSIVAELKAFSIPVVIFVHPRLQIRADELGLSLRGGNLYPSEPLPYQQLIGCLQQSAGVITDSGGLQKEAYLLGVPCTTIRRETEWPETLVDGWNVLVPDAAAVSSTALRARPVAERSWPYGRGGAAEAVLQSLRGFWRCSH
jgi:UDP-N-acetylglucosamine 2-epimerase (non-hydrolysing)